jgi:hypothetical protein
VTFVDRHVPGERVAHVTLPTFGYNLPYSIYESLLNDWGCQDAADL